MAAVSELTGWWGLISLALLAAILLACVVPFRSALKSHFRVRNAYRAIVSEAGLYDQSITNRSRNAVSFKIESWGKNYEPLTEKCYEALEQEAKKEILQEGRHNGWLWVFRPSSQFHCGRYMRIYQHGRAMLIVRSKQGSRRIAYIMSSMNGLSQRESNRLAKKLYRRFEKLEYSFA